MNFFSKFSKGILKIFVGPLHVFTTILLNIGQLTYIVRYVLNIKSTCFLRNFKKKFQKKSKNTKKKAFHVSRNAKMNIITGL
jgi:ABC-type uncharacterized transport system permease subunit